MPTHYELLGVAPTATIDEIKKGYRKACRLTHPDKGGDEEMFKTVTAAMEVLSDEVKRMSYDRSLGYTSRLGPASVAPTVNVHGDVKKESWWDGVYAKTKEYVKTPKQAQSGGAPKTAFVFESVRSHFSKAELVGASRIKIISLGIDGSGKSALIKRFCEGRFIDKYITTVGVDYGVKPVELGNKKVVKINFFDLSGLATFAAVRAEFYRQTQGLLLVFDVGNLASFRAVVDLHNETKGNRFATVLVGNKIDGNRAVTFEEAKRLADSLGAKYFETSAATGEGVNVAFLALFESAYNLADYAKGG